MFQASNIRVARFLIYETLGYDDMFRRAYKTSADGMAFDALAERIARQDRVTPDTVIGLTNGFIAPDINTESNNPIFIPDGWGARRCRFLLELEYDFGGLGSKIREAFMGWTDHYGLSLQSQAIDQDMVFHLNSVSHMKIQEIPTLNGMEKHYSVLDTSHIIAAQQHHGSNGVFNNEKLFRMRPDDLFATMQLSHLDTGGTYDDRTRIGTGAQKASRSSNITTNYMSKILDSYLTSARNQGDLGQDAPDILENARSRSYQTSSASQDPFLREISRLENGGTYIQDHFTYRTLLSIDPNADNMAEVQVLPGVVRDAWQGNTSEESWGGRDLYGQFATILAQSVPTILMETGLQAIRFQSTNRKIGQQIETTIQGIKSFSEVFSLAQQGNTFIERVNREIMLDLSFNGQMDYGLIMEMSIHGDCIIELSLNNDQNMHRYVAPLFADAFFSPIITGDQQRSFANADHFGQLAHKLSEVNLLGSATSTNIQVGAGGMAF